MKSVTRLHRSSAIQAYRDLLVRDFHPLVTRAVKARVVSQGESEGSHRHRIALARAHALAPVRPQQSRLAQSVPRRRTILNAFALMPIRSNGADRYTITV
jgi:hypothetical protein